MIGQLTNHLWQSTLFAIVAALLAIAFRKSQAAVRYWLWFSASFKFFIPFSPLMGIGSHLGWAPIARTVVTPSLSFTMEQITQPFPNALPPALPISGSTVDWVPLSIIGVFFVWLCGFGAIALMRSQGWRKIRAAVRSSTPTDIPATVEVRASPGLLEPGVVGLFRPILLVPEGIAQRLTPSQLEAVLAHESCHVRRRDNLTSATHMVVEAVFWFHPLVWWIGARLMEERERACDEAVLSLGNEPNDYAEGILNVCKNYLESPLSCVSGVTGSNLTKRLQAILTGRIPTALNLPSRVALGVVAITALAAPIVVGMMHAPSPSAFPSNASIPKFAAAAITPCQTFSHRPVPETPGRLQTGCTTVQRFVQQAYGLFAGGHMNEGSSLTVTGGPGWTTSDLYQIDAKADGQGQAMMHGPMLQSFLEDRLKLKLHRETRKVPVYALAVADGGPNLRPFQGSCTPRDFDNPPSPADCATARASGSSVDMKAATMADLCTAFSVFLGRHVVDETGIVGRFNMHLDLSAEDRGLLYRARSLPAMSDPTTPPPPPVLLQAAKIAMKKLGLNIDPSNGPDEFIIIDSVAKP
jgi:uncharacterized protein (TIGR03435 family)